MINNINLPIHHIGIATKSIQCEARLFKFFGFIKEDEFIDMKQGVRGIFMINKECYKKNDFKMKGSFIGQYRFELLENIEGSTTLNNYLRTHNKMYHIAFESNNIEKDVKKILDYNFNQQLEVCQINGGGVNMTIKSANNKNNIIKQQLKAKLIIPIMESSYFSKLCFIMLPNRLLIEIVELKKEL